LKANLALRADSAHQNRNFQTRRHIEIHKIFKIK
jgi:hypothetical protein